MEQQAFFHETVEDAIREDVRTNGDFKAVGHKLKPTKSPTDAATWLRNNLNANQEGGITYKELMVILDDAGEKRHSAFLDFLGQRYGFRIEWIEPEDELTKLLREWKADKSRSQTRDDRIARALERAEQRATLKVVPR